VIAVEEPIPALRNDRPQPQLPLDQRQIPQVFSVNPEQIESVKPGRTTSKQQVFELCIAIAVEAFYLAVEHRSPDTQFSVNRACRSILAIERLGNPKSLSSIFLHSSRFPSAPAPSAICLFSP
jgi:hypothetical protein